MADPTTHTGISRRTLLKRTAATGAGLIIGTHLTLGKKRARAAEPPAGRPAPPPPEPNAFLRIAPDDSVTILSKHIEFGQGTYTGLATLIAEELDADWAQMRAEAAPAGPAYKNLLFGAQGTGGSSSIANSYLQMRQVGASARAMLVSAAATAWGVPAAEITVAKGVISHASGKTSGFGALADAAMKLPLPKDAPLKDPKDFILIGTTLPRLDTPAKLVGGAEYTIDIKRPNMVTALVVHPTRFGAKAVGFDDTKAKQIPGFIAAANIGAGVAIYADGFWPAKRASHALDVKWDETGTESRSSAALLESFAAKLGEAGVSATKRGDVNKRMATPKEGDRAFSADFSFPYLAHAPMEPLDCVLERTADGGVEAWFGCQFPGIDQPTIAGVLGLTPDKVKINVVFGGGSFGRRAQGDGSFAVEAALVLKSAPEGKAVKLVWTREDDIRGGYYRPIYAHRLEAIVDKDDQIAAWRHRVVGQSIMAATPFKPPEGAADPSSVEGASNQPYAVPDFAVELHTEEVGVPVLWWRSVGSTHTAFSVETFLDELLEATGQDPVAGRLALLKDHPRHAQVLKVAAEMAGWGTRELPKGRALGVALHESFRSYVAQIAEVSVTPTGMPKVHKVWCAVDCGVAINPDIVKAQMEGGLGYGLGAALYNAIDLVDGRVVQRNFDDYRPLRMHDMPDVETTVIKSTEAPTGVGEPGTPPIAPAIANAYYKLTGRRVRTQPFERAQEGT